MRYVCTYVRTYTVRTDKLAIEHTSVGLAHARPISSGMEDKWGEYYKLCLEIKGLVRKKGWNEVIEKGNKVFYKNSKEFWAFVGRTSKGNRCFLRSTSSSCITSTKGKLEVGKGYG